MLGLTPTVPLSEEYLREMMVLSMAAMWSPSDAGLALTGNVISGINVAETTASGSQAPNDTQHPKESLAMSRQGRSKSPHGRIGRELSPKSRTAELRARMARVQQKKMTQYLMWRRGPTRPFAFVPRAHCRVVTLASDNLIRHDHFPRTCTLPHKDTHNNNKQIVPTSR